MWKRPHSDKDPRCAIVSTLDRLCTAIPFSRARISQVFFLRQVLSVPARYIQNSEDMLLLCVENKIGPIPLQIVGREHAHRRVRESMVQCERFEHKQ